MPHISPYTLHATNTVRCNGDDNDGGGDDGGGNGSQCANRGGEGVGGRAAVVIMLDGSGGDAGVSVLTNVTVTVGRVGRQW